MRNRKVYVILALVTLALAALVLPQPAEGISACEMGLCNFTYRTILPDGYMMASFDSLNESGLVVGKCTDENGVEWGFIYSLFTGEFMPIKPPGWKQAWASSVNESGVVVGGGIDGSDIRKGFIYDDAATGNYIELLPPGWARATATHINDNDTGTVVGYGKKSGESTFTSFIYAGGTFTEINLAPDLHNVQATAINNSGKVVGTANLGFSDARGFLYDPENGVTVMDPGGWAWTGALNINQLDEVAGWGEDGSGNNRGYLYSEGNYTVLSHDTLPFTVANDVSDTGLVVGTFNDNPGYPGCIGFIFDSNSSAYIDLAPGWHSLAPRAVNAIGVVVGWCEETAAGPEKAFVAFPPGMPTPVPQKLAAADPFAENPEAYQHALEGVTPHGSPMAIGIIKLLK